MKKISFSVRLGRDRIIELLKEHKSLTEINKTKK